MDWLSDADFMIRSHCGIWSPTLIAVYMFANVCIALSYFVIPIQLLLVTKHYKMRKTPKAWIILLFALFIFACGVGHVLDGVMPFVWPSYRVIAAWHCVTAVASVGTMMVVPRLAIQQLIDDDSKQRTTRQ